MVAASRTYEPEWAQELLQLLGIDHYFQQKEVYPSSKLKDFQRFRKSLKLPYSEMVFLDDENRNIAEIGKLGVQTVHVRNGVKMDQIDRFL